MRRNNAVAIILLIVSAWYPGVLGAVVFHGRDRETGVEISRTSVDTITPAQAMSVGLRIVRVHKTGQVTLAFTSFDDRLKDLDRSSASLIIDAEPVPLEFKHYLAHILVKGIPPLHEIWFGAIDPSAVARIKECKTLSLQIVTVSGIPVKRTLKLQALADVKEVLLGPAKVVERAEGSKPPAPERIPKEPAEDKKTVVVNAGEKGLLMAPLDTSHFVARHDPTCANYTPDYSKFHTIVHLFANAPLGTTERNGKKVKVYVVTKSGQDAVSGQARRLGYSADAGSLFVGAGSRNKTMKMEMRLGAPGTRITFDGDANDVFEPVAGLRVWDGAIDIDPQCGMIVHAKGAK